MPSSANLVFHRLLRSVGLRLMRASNCPRGTESKLYSDVRTHFRKTGQPLVVLDIGANQGDFSSAILEALPESSIHAYEPSPQVFAVLQRRHEGNDRVICHRKAVGARTGSLPFELRPDDDKLGRLVSAASDHTVDVEVTTVDQIRTEENIEMIGLLKTDTEGHEMQVLEGALSSFQKQRILAVMVEVTLGPQTERHVALDKAACLLQSHGFRLHGVYDLGYDRHSGKLRFCNALFKHRSCCGA